MGNVSASITQYTVQGNRRVHFGTLTMSSSYAASGDAYTDLSTFGMTTVEHLDLLPVGSTIGFHGYWNSGATAIKVVTSRPQSSYTPGATALVLFNTTATNVVSVQPAGGSVFTTTGSIALSYTRGNLVCLVASNSNANDIATALATNAMGLLVSCHVYARTSTNLPGTALYAGTSGVLFTTSSVTVTSMLTGGGSFIQVSDGGLLFVGSDTTASYRVSVDDALGNGLRLHTTNAATISIPIQQGLSMGQSTEPPTGADLSTSGANVAFRFTALGY